MPTGYTAPIADGMTFEQYALGCARAFGALVTMRDEPSNAPIPERLEPDTYYQRSLEASQLELDRVMSLTASEIVVEAEKSYVTAYASWQERCKRRADLREKYEAILRRVRAYVAPTLDHVGYKDFMEKQLVDSIAWDCNDSHDDEPQRVAPAKWIADRLEDLRHEVARREQSAREEVERTHKRNQWIKALRDSLTA
jgi:hypothetical protein